MFWLEYKCEKPPEEVAWIVSTLNVNGVTPLK